MILFINQFPNDICIKCALMNFFTIQIYSPSILFLMQKNYLKLRTNYECVRIRGKFSIEKYFQVSGYKYLTFFPTLQQLKMTSNNCQARNQSEKGVGLYALKSFKKGDIVYVCEVEAYDVPNGSHPSQVDMNKWVLFTETGRSINHSCNPNCGIGFDGSNWLYTAFKDINVGDELTYDYGMANYVVENLPNCLCGSNICRRDIQGFRNLPKEKKLEYKGFFAPYLQKMVESQAE